MSDKPIHYEPHPVAPERKAELLAQGFRILDIQFAPDDWKAGESDKAEPEDGKRSRKK